MICDYGCGKEAKYPFKNGKWCCSKSFRQCTFYKNKHSIAMKGYKHSDESKDKISNSLRGNQNNKGKKRSEETKNKIRNAVKGNQNWKNKKHTLESRKKISDTRKKLKIRHTNETIKKIAELNKGKNSWNKGMKLRTIKYLNKTYPFFSKIEEMRYNPNIHKEIQVHCKNHNCINSKEQNGWFTPTYTQLYERIRQLEHPDGNGGNYFYCCDECKQECPLYHLKGDPNKKIEIYYTQSEYNIWRTEVLERAEYLCEYCKKEAIDVHHIKPQKLEPFFALDPDYGIACCKECHYRYGHKDECSTGKLANEQC